MIKNIPVGDVKTTRKLVEPLTPFEGVLDPILIDEGGVLIDGLRRLEWAISQGHETIRSEVAKDFPTAVKNLERARRGTRMSMRRVWELQQALRPMQDAWARTQRTEGNRNRRKPGWVPAAKSTRGRGRNMLVQATGETQFQSVVRLFRLAEENPNGEHAKRLALYEAGKLNKSRTLASVKKGDPGSFFGPVKNAAEQLQLIKKAADTLHSTVLGMNNLSEPILANPDDYAQAITDMRASRARISTFIHILEKARKHDD